MSKTKRIIAAVTATIITAASASLMSVFADENGGSDHGFVSSGAKAKTDNNEKAISEAQLYDKLGQLLKDGESLKYGEALYTTGTPDGEKWLKEFYELRIEFYGEEFLAKYIVDGEFLRDKVVSDIEKINAKEEKSELNATAEDINEYMRSNGISGFTYVREADGVKKIYISYDGFFEKIKAYVVDTGVDESLVVYQQSEDYVIVSDKTNEEKTAAQKYGDAIAEYMANNDIQGVVSRSVPDEKLSIGFHGDHEAQLKAYISEIGLDKSGIPYEFEKLPDFSELNDLNVTTVSQPTITVTTTTTTVVDDPSLITSVATVKIMDISGDVILVKPVDGSWELKSADKFTLSAKQLPADVTPKVGMKLEIAYNGGILETYPAMFGNIQKITVVTETDTDKEDTTLLSKIPLEGTYSLKLNVMDIVRNEKIAGLDCELFNLQTKEVIATWNTSGTEEMYIENLKYSFDKADSYNGNITYAIRITNLPENYRFFYGKTRDQYGVSGFGLEEFANGTDLSCTVYLEDTSDDAPKYTYVTTVQENITTTTTTTVNSINGDANCDGQVDLSDAVMIMQALANPNKYGIDGTAEHHLTEQGKLNGDMDGDGLTVGDARAIQSMLLGID